MYKRLTKEQLDEILLKEETQWNRNKKTLRHELKRQMMLYQNVSRKWDIIGFLWEKKVQQLERELEEL